MRDVAVTSDGKRAVSGDEDATLRVWNLSTGKSRYTLRGHTDWVTAVVVTVDGSRAVSASRDSTLRVWDLTTGKLLHVLEGHTDYVEAVAVTEDGLHAFSVSADKTIRVWDLGTGSCLAWFDVESALDCCVLSPDGRRVAAGDKSGQVHLLSLEVD